MTMKLIKTAIKPTIAAISVAIFAIVNARADVLEVGEGRAYSDIQSAIDATVEGNVFGTDAKFKNAKYVPYASSPLFDKGVFADWMVGAKDLRGNPRVTERGKVTIGCYQVEPTGLMLLVK